MCESASRQLRGEALAQHPSHSQIAPDVQFEGRITLTQGSLTVAGVLTGQVEASSSPDGEGHVTIADSGVFDGELRARSLSVLGRSQGLLDVAGGRVALHARAVVSGRLRYGLLQVNGADLNAQLERVARRSPSSPEAPWPSATTPQG